MLWKQQKHNKTVWKLSNRSQSAPIAMTLFVLTRDKQKYKIFANKDIKFVLEKIRNLYNYVQN